ncbi:MAG: hypothetical protein ACI89J_004580 [Hyphomicrobiaceae bacterium]|jgi:hypothetical protein
MLLLNLGVLLADCRQGDFVMAADKLARQRPNLAQQKAIGCPFGIATR